MIDLFLYEKEKEQFRRAVSSLMGIANTIQERLMKALWEIKQLDNLNRKINLPSQEDHEKYQYILQKNNEKCISEMNEFEVSEIKEKILEIYESILIFYNLRLYLKNNNLENDLLNLGDFNK